MTCTDYASGMRLSNCSKLSINRKNDNDVSVFRNGVIIKFFDVVLFLLSSLVTGTSFMSISSLFLELWQFSFIMDWPKVRKSEIPLSEFCPISGDWSKLRIPNLPRLSLIKFYWMLKNANVTAFTVSELLSKNQQGSKITAPTNRLELIDCVNLLAMKSVRGS